jgi:hypothetical protein
MAIDQNFLVRDDLRSLQGKSKTRRRFPRPILDGLDCRDRIERRINLNGIFELFLGSLPARFLHNSAFVASALL